MKPNTPSQISNQNSNSSSLGSLLLFIGHSCYAFNTLWSISQNGTSAINKALCALPSWQQFIAESSDHEAADTFCNAIRKLNDDKEWRNEANEDFQQLFHAPEPLVPLWESVWLSKEKILFTEETTQVRNWYRRFNFAITAAGFEAEDHIGLEIAFCGWLYETAVNNAIMTSQKKADFSLVDEFIDQHLGKWGPACLKALTSHTKSAFWSIFLQTSESLISALCLENGELPTTNSL